MKHYAGQPILTFALIDKVHHRVEGTASLNFRANRKRFIGEKGFYDIDSESLDEFHREFPDVVEANAPSLTRSPAAKDFPNPYSNHAAEAVNIQYLHKDRLGSPKHPSATHHIEIARNDAHSFKHLNNYLETQAELTGVSPQHLGVRNEHGERPRKEATRMDSNQGVSSTESAP